MEDEFILPDIWKLLVTDENFNLINDWRLNNFIGHESFDRYYKYIGHDGWGHQIPNTLITTEQFIKHVLKETDNTYNISIPEDLSYLIELFTKLNIS